MVKKYFVILCILVLARAGNAAAQELTDEELEILQNLDMLEDMELLEQDMTLLENYEDIASDDVQTGDYDE